MEGSCYAFVSADMLSAYLDEPVSVFSYVRNVQ